MARASKTLFKGLAALACVVLLAAAGARPGTAGQAERVPMPEKTIEAVLEDHTPRLISLPGVVGIGEGRCAGAPCIKVLVIEKTDDLAARIGDAIDGYPVEIGESGEIRAQQPGGGLP